MRSDVALFLIFIYFFSAGLWSVGPGGASDSYLVRAWTIEDGLPQNSVLSLVQTKEGYIWFGTQSGLVRFDGVLVRVFNRWNTRVLKNDHILCLYEDSGGNVWAGTDGGGVCRLKDGRWTAFTIEQGLTHNTVRAITEDRDHFVWVGTDNGLNRIKDDRIERYTMDDGLSGPSVTALFPGRDGSLWIGTGSSGLNRLKDDKFRVIPVYRGDSVTVLHEDGSGALWMGTEKGVYRLGKSGLVQVAPGSPVQSVSSLLEDRGGGLWIGTEGEGLYRYEKNRFVRVTPRHQLPDYFIYSMLQDNEGNIWLGTYTAGLIRLKKAAVRTFTRENGLPENFIRAVTQDETGALWIGTDRSGVCGFREGRLTVTITAAGGLSGNRTRSLWRDRDGTLWIGTESGLNRWKEGTNRIYTTASGLSSNTVTVLFRDRSGSLWIGTDDGLNRWTQDEGSFDVYKQRSGLRDTNIRIIAEDGQGRLLVGTRGGLFMLDHESGRFMAIGRSKREGRFDYDILALHEDRQGRLWLGTNGSGLILLEQKNGQPVRHRFFTTAEGLPNNYIFSINEDSRGDLWMSSQRGIFRFPMAAPEPGETPPAIVLLDENEGMGSSQCSSSGYPSAWKAASGTFFIPTVKGIAMFDPETLIPLKTPPPVKIETVIADNQPVSPAIIKTGGLSLSPETQVVEFYFTALSYTSPGKTRFRYMLEGFDRDWNEMGPRQQRTALYLNLPPGGYRFRVMASGNGGAWNTEGAGFDFRITRPFYRQPLLVVFILALAAGVILALLVRRFKTRRAAGYQSSPGPPAAEEKYKTSALQPETVEAVLPELTRLMEEEQAYLDPELSLKQLAHRLHVHYNYLSRIINEHQGKSFNDYINFYRIEEARKRLCDGAPAAAKKTVLEIAYDTGFYSKSVFNTAFKKFTGMTPSQYRKKCKSG
jgi:ligand-binding sensor domain-containing protein/AraC-like DNA-binding protein